MTTSTPHTAAGEALAGSSRPPTLGVLGASIAFELNQPLSAIVLSAAACTRFLAAQPPNFDKAQRALERIANEGRRASELIAELRMRVKARVSRQP